MDLARCNDGTIIIVELGDGQVAGSYQIKAEEFYKAIRGKNSTQIETPFPKNVTVFLRDPMPGKNIDEMKQEMEHGVLWKPVTDQYRDFQRIRITSSILGHCISVLSKKGGLSNASIYSCIPGEAVE
ncbi:MAG: ATP-grasp domain-containing protein [Lachnoclostridium sp.]